MPYRYWNSHAEGFHADEMHVIERAVVRGLAAQIRSDCRVLVLGSMPGVASLRATQYYAHPRNRFWPLMSRLLAVDGPGYDQRLARLQAAGIGLWDVIGQCARVGSLDSAIERDSVVPNPLPECLAELGQLRAVACNGAESASALAALGRAQAATRRAGYPAAGAALHQPGQRRFQPGASGRRMAALARFPAGRECPLGRHSLSRLCPTIRGRIVRTANASSRHPGHIFAGNGWRVGPGQPQ